MSETSSKDKANDQLLRAATWVRGKGRSLYEHPKAVLGRHWLRQTLWPFETKANGYNLNSIDTLGELAPALSLLALYALNRLSDDAFEEDERHSVDMKPLKSLILSQIENSNHASRMAFAEITGVSALSSDLPSHPIVQSVLSRVDPEVAKASRPSKLAILFARVLREPIWVPVAFWVAALSLFKLSSLNLDAQRQVRGFERKTFITDGQNYLSAPNSSAGLLLLIALEAERKGSTYEKWYLWTERRRLAKVAQHLATQIGDVSYHDQILISEILLLNFEGPLKPNQPIVALLPALGLPRYDVLMAHNNPDRDMAKVNASFQQATPDWLYCYLKSKRPTPVPTDGQFNKRAYV